MCVFPSLHAHPVFDENLLLEVFTERLDEIKVPHEASNVDGSVAHERHVLYGTVIEEELDHL